MCERLKATGVIRRVFVLSLCLAPWGEAQPARAELKVGAAVRVITPDPLLPISGGMGIPRPA